MTLKELLMNDSSWYQVYKFLPWTNAKELSKMVLLSMIIDADSFISERLKEDYSYFMCTNGFLKKTYSAGWSDNTITSYFKELEDAGYIFTKRVPKKGYNYPPRYVKINNQILKDMYQDLKDVPQDLKDVPQDLKDVPQDLLINNNKKQKHYNNTIRKEREAVFESGSSLEKRKNIIYTGTRDISVSEDPLPERSELSF